MFLRQFDRIKMRNRVLLLSMLIFRTTYAQFEDIFGTIEYERALTNIYFEYYGKNISACNQAKMLEPSALEESAACDNAMYAVGSFSNLTSCPDKCLSLTFNYWGKECTKAFYTTVGNLGEQLVSAYTKGQVPPLRDIEALAKINAASTSPDDFGYWYNVFSNPTENDIIGYGERADETLIRDTKDNIIFNRALTRLCVDEASPISVPPISSATFVFGTHSLARIVSIMAPFVFLVMV